MATTQFVYVEIFEIILNKLARYKVISYEYLEIILFIQTNKLSMWIF